LDILSAKRTALFGACGLVLSVAGCGGGGVSTNATGLCPTSFAEQHVNLSGKIASIDPIPLTSVAAGVYLAVVEDDAGLPCQVLTRERPASGAETTFTDYVAHRDDKGTPTEFLYPAKSPDLATAFEPASVPAP
jgi:hypothetical protein